MFIEVFKSNVQTYKAIQTIILLKNKLNSYLMKIKLIEW
jgi:hypothetical protein